MSDGLCFLSDPCHCFKTCLESSRLGLHTVRRSIRRRSQAASPSPTPISLSTRVRGSPGSDRRQCHWSIHSVSMCAQPYVADVLSRTMQTLLEKTSWTSGHGTNWSCLCSRRGLLCGADSPCENRATHMECPGSRRGPLTLHCESVCHTN